MENEKRYYNWFLTIEFYDKSNDKNISTKELEEACSCFRAKYYFILHDRDFNEDGSLKHAHYHLLLRFVNGTTQSSILNKLSDLLNCDKALIGCKKANDYNLCIRYLFHLDDLDKVSYIDCPVTTNDYPGLRFAVEFNGRFTAEDLNDLVNQFGGDVHMLQSYLGLNIYMKYRLAIKDLIRGL